MNAEEAKNFSHVLDPKDEGYTACGIVADVSLEIKEKEPTCLECVQALSDTEPKKRTKVDTKALPTIHFLVEYANKGGRAPLCDPDITEGTGSTIAYEVTCPKCLSLMPKHFEVHPEDRKPGEWTESESEPGPQPEPQPQPEPDQEEPVVHWACIGSLSACGNNQSGLASSDISEVTCLECQTLYKVFANKKPDQGLTVLVAHIGTNELTKIMDGFCEGLFKRVDLSKLQN